MTCKQRMLRVCPVRRSSLLATLLPSWSIFSTKATLLLSRITNVFAELTWFSCRSCFYHLLFSTWIRPVWLPLRSSALSKISTSIRCKSILGPHFPLSAFSSLWHSSSIGGTFTVSTQRYGYCSLIFYWGYLIGRESIPTRFIRILQRSNEMGKVLPGVYFAQRFPLGKYVAIVVRGTIV